MALKVISNNRPNVKLKVSTKPVNYVTPKTYNPQKSQTTQRAANIAPRTYNPQRTASSAQLNNAKVSSDWAQLEAQRLRAEADERARLAEIKRRRLADAKNTEIAGYKGGFAGMLGDKLTFGDIRRQHNSRDLAYEYAVENERVWRGNIEVRQRNFERDAGKLKQWVLGSTTSAQYEERYNYAINWLEKSAKSIDDDIDDFNNTQKELIEWSQRPLKGGLASIGRVSKNIVKKIGSTTWNALNWTTTQGERLTNTAKNFVNPNNVRLYYDGNEKKAPQDIVGQGSNLISRGWDQLRKSYNASQDQRIAGFGKDEEAKRLAANQQRFDLNKDNKNILGSRFSNNVNQWSRNVADFNTRYFDDVLNFAVDPLNFLPNNWFSKGTKAVKGSKLGQQFAKFGSKTKDDFYKLAANNGQLTKFLVNRAAKADNPNSLRKWITRRVGTNTDDFYADNRKLIEFRNNLASEFSERSSAWKSLKRGFSAETQSRLSKLTDDEARMLQEFMLHHTFGNQKSLKLGKNVFSWDNVQTPRGFNKASRSKIEDLARALRNESDRLTRMSIDYDDIYNQGLNHKRFLKTAKAYKKGEGLQYSYIPNWSPKAGSKLENSTRASRWYLKEKAGDSRIQQGAAQLKQSFAKRASDQLWNDTPEGRWLANNADDYKGMIDEASKLLGVRKKFYDPNAFGKLNNMSLRNKLSLTKLWRNAVLPLNPAWYVNNIATNIPFSISAGGAGVIPEYLKMLRKSGRVFDDIPEGVKGNIDEFIGSKNLGWLGSKVEDTSRIATYRALKKRGFSDADALKEVNRWLFDYSVKNWERPLRSVAPFYKWQANLMRLGVQMPFTNPRSAKFYNSIQQQFFERPLNELPEGQQNYTDPDTGLPATYDPRAAYRGKFSLGADKNGNSNFYNTPFWAMNPYTMTNFGIHPALGLLQDYTTMTDSFGNSLAGRSFGSLALDKTPQGSLLRHQANRNNKDSSHWFSDSGNSKWKQGYDPSLPNYDKNMDNERKFDRRLNSFLGIPNETTFSRTEYDKKERLTKFNKEFFAVDWQELENEDYNAAQAAKKAIANKYGFDLQKDIYDREWSKYDTKSTTRTKEQKRDAALFTKDFWQGYTELPKGSPTNGVSRREYVINKFDEWRRDNAFLKNGYRNLPAFNEYDSAGKKTGNKKIINPIDYATKAERSRKGSIRYQEYQKAKQTGDWSWFDRNGGGTEKSRDYRLAKASGDWSAYRSKYGDSSKSSPFQFEGKYFKSQESMDRYIEGAFWQKYYATDSLEERQALLEANPQFKQFETPKTQAEWDVVRELLRRQRYAKLDSLDGFGAMRSDTEKRIMSTLPSGFGRSKRLRYKFQ